MGGGGSVGVVSEAVRMAWLVGEALEGAGVKLLNA